MKNLSTKIKKELKVGFGINPIQFVELKAFFEKEFTNAYNAIHHDDPWQVSTDLHYYHDVNHYIPGFYL